MKGQKLEVWLTYNFIPVTNRSIVINDQSVFEESNHVQKKPTANFSMGEGGGVGVGVLN